MGERLIHVGLSVASLERSVKFYRDGFGMELVGQNEFRGNLYESILGIKGATGIVALMKGDALQVELFEFWTPPPRRADPARPVCDHGLTHFCIEVDDIDGAYRRLQAAGASFHCPPLDFYGVATATYGRDPDGNVFELIKTGTPG